MFGFFQILHIPIFLAVLVEVKYVSNYFSNNVRIIHSKISEKTFPFQALFRRLKIIPFISFRTQQQQQQIVVATDYLFIVC